MASSGEGAGTGPLITVQVRTLSTGNHDVRVPATVSRVEREGEQRRSRCTATAAAAAAAACLLPAAGFCHASLACSHTDAHTLHPFVCLLLEDPLCPWLDCLLRAGHSGRRQAAAGAAHRPARRAPAHDLRVRELRAVVEIAQRLHLCAAARCSTCSSSVHPHASAMYPALPAC